MYFLRLWQGNNKSKEKTIKEEKMFQRRLSL